MIVWRAQLADGEPKPVEWPDGVVVPDGFYVSRGAAWDEIERLADSALAAVQRTIEAEERREGWVRSVVARRRAEMSVSYKSLTGCPVCHGLVAVLVCEETGEACHPRCGWSGRLSQLYSSIPVAKPMPGVV